MYGQLFIKGLNADFKRSVTRCESSLEDKNERNQTFSKSDRVSSQDLYNSNFTTHTNY